MNEHTKKLSDVSLKELIVLAQQDHATVPVPQKGNKRELLPPIRGGRYRAKKILLPLRTRLYNGMGGWTITKDGEIYFIEETKREYDRARTLCYIERRAKLQPECDWRAELNLPLRSETYQRQGKSKWVLVKKGQGFA